MFEKSLTSYKGVLKSIIRKFKPTPSKHGKFNEYIKKLTLPGVETTSDKVVTEIFKWYAKLHENRSFKFVIQRKLLMEILTSVMGRNEVNKEMERYGLDSRVKYKFI